LAVLNSLTDRYRFIFNYKNSVQVRFAASGTASPCKSVFQPIFAVIAALDISTTGLEYFVTSVPIWFNLK
jgi:hypothetical protein